MDFVKDHEELYMTRLMNISRTKQGRGLSGISYPTVATCLSRCARPCLSRKGDVMAS